MKSDHALSDRAEISALKQSVPIARIFEAHGTVPDATGMARCPWHEDSTPSLHVVSAEGYFKCHGCDAKGDHFEALKRFEGLDFKAALSRLQELAGKHPAPAPQKEKKPKPPAVLPVPAEALAKLNDFVCSSWMEKHFGIATLGSKYRNEKGEVMVPVVRLERTLPDGKTKKQTPALFCGTDDQWYMGNPLKDGRPILNLPEILAAPDKFILIVEGERCADVAGKASQNGYIPTTWMGGCKAVAKTDWTFLRGRVVTIWPDNDAEGISAAEWIARTLHSLDCRVSVVSVPKGKTKGWDIADALTENVDTMELIEAARPWIPPREVASVTLDAADVHKASPEDARPVIQANNRDLRELAAECWGALLMRNSPPRLFQRSRELIRIIDGKIDPLSDFALRYELAKAASFVDESTRGKITPTAPPMEAVHDLPTWETLPIPELDAVVSGPLFAEDGELLTEPGYHAKAKAYITKRLDVPIFRGNGAEAAKWIYEELYSDFPFESDADKANAMGALLTCCLRRMIKGSTPLNGVEAPVHGAGKGLYVDLTADVAFDRPGAEHMGYSDVEEELRKHITSTLRGAPGAVKLDNVRDRIDSATLSGFITARMWSDRQLGASVILTYKVNCVLFSTGNNPTLSGEMARRYVRIRLQPKTDHPEMRTGFRHPAILEWAEAHRGEILGAVASMVRTWIKAGRPEWSGIPLGSFESWCRVVGGILESCGIKGFLTNHLAVFETADTDAAQWSELIEKWHKAYGENWIPTSDLFNLATEIETFPMTGNTTRAQKTSFGMALAKQKDRVYADRQVVKEARKYNARYCLRKIASKDDQPPQPFQPFEPFESVSRGKVPPVDVVHRDNGIAEGPQKVGKVPKVSEGPAADLSNLSDDELHSRALSMVEIINASPPRPDLLPELQSLEAEIARRTGGDS